MHKNLFKNKYRKSSLQRGMTLIELMVVLAIFMIVSSITIFDYSKFRSNAALDNLADDIALSIRTAQNYGIGARNTVSGASGTGVYQGFGYGFGIHFSTIPPSDSDVRAGSNKSFIIYNDLYNDTIYEYTNSPTTCNSSTLHGGRPDDNPVVLDECLEMINITSDASIVAICPNGDGDPANPKCQSDLETDIAFRRQHVEPANFCTRKVVNSVPTWPCLYSGQVSGVDIVIQNATKDRTKVISISTIGQITVK